jgi:hypothetical protein
MKSTARWLLCLAPLAVLAQDNAKPEDTEQWQPVPSIVSTFPGEPPPSDAKVLFDGHNLDATLLSSSTKCLSSNTAITLS